MSDSSALRDSAGLRPAIPYVAPFAVLIGFLALHAVWPFSALAEQLLALAILIPVTWFFARRVTDFHTSSSILSVTIGVAIFFLWIAPDTLFPAYRHSGLFENGVTGFARSSLSQAARRDPLTLSLRAARAVVIVPVAEELFWRGWVMRWLISPDFTRIPLGAFRWSAFLITALLFASEHGPYWDVGLVTGLILNAWMVRTKNLADLMVAHAAANACLSAYVIAAGKWEYWL